MDAAIGFPPSSQIKSNIDLYHVGVAYSLSLTLMCVKSKVNSIFIDNSPQSKHTSTRETFSAGQRFRS